MLGSQQVLICAGISGFAPCSTSKLTLVFRDLHAWHPPDGFPQNTIILYSTLPNLGPFAPETAYLGKWPIDTPPEPV